MCEIKGGVGLRQCGDGVECRLGEDDQGLYVRKVIAMDLRQLGDGSGWVTMHSCFIADV